MADEARLNELLDLVEQARAEGDSATEQKAISAYRRESGASSAAQALPPPSFYPQISMSAYKPPGMPDFSGLMERVEGSLGVTADPSQDKPVRGALETVAAGGSALGGTIAGGLAGIGQGFYNLFDENGTPAADRVRKVQEAMIYQPRTYTGQMLTGITSKPGEKLGELTNKGGEWVTDKTGSPLLGTILKTAGDTVLPAATTKLLPKRGAPGEKAHAGDKFGVPSRTQLAAASDDAYKRADEAGLSMTAESFERMKAGLLADLQKDGIDPTLHPKATAAIKRISEETGPLTLQKAETLRRVATDAMDTLEKSDARKSGMIVDALDDYIDNLTDADVVTGKAKDAAALKEARGLYTRKRKAEDMERLIDRAKLSPSGVENGLRIEFRALVKNERKFRRFSKEEQAAIRRVAEGGPIENTLRWAGKLAPTGAVSGGISAGIGFAAGGPAGAIGLPAGSWLARKGSELLTSRNARQAEELMRRGPRSTGGLLSGGPTTQPLVAQQGLLGSAETPSVATSRSPAQVQADISRLAARVQFELATESAGSPKVRAAIAELQALQRELEAIQAGQ